jgi:hypothetical protein
MPLFKLKFWHLRIANCYRFLSKYYIFDVFSICILKIATLEFLENSVSFFKIFLLVSYYNYRYIHVYNFSFDNSFAVVEDMYKRRQPLPSMDAIYFIQPTKEKYVVF